MLFKEKILSSKENPNGTTSVKSTSHNINTLFFLSLIIGGGIVYSLYGRENPLIMCQNSYMKSTNELLRYNEENPDFPVPLPEYNCNKLLNLTDSGAETPPPKQQEVTILPFAEEGFTQEERLDLLHINVCNKQINSPLCKDRKLFDRLYQLTEERLPNKQFFPILIGMTNAESSLGLDFAKDNVGGRCDGRNNWGGAKYNIKDDNSREYSRSYNGFLYGSEHAGRFVDQYGCNLFPFKSIEEYWISKVNGIRYGYKGCIDHPRPIWCISGPYVGKAHVHEQSWIDNVSYFLN